METTGIKRVTPTGAELHSGEHHVLDVLVCSTGYDASFRYPFDAVGRGWQTLRERWNPHAEAYLARAVDGFPLVRAQLVGLVLLERLKNMEVREAVRF